MKRLLLAAPILACTLLSACSRDEPTQTTDTAMAPDPYTLSIQQWRRERAQRLMKPDGWLSLVGLHWLDPGAHYVGSDADNGIRLATGPAHLGLFRVDGKRIEFTPEDGVVVKVDGQTAAGTLELKPDSSGQPSIVAFDEDQASLLVIERAGRYALRVRDSRAESRIAFTGIDSFDIDPAWRFEARFEPHEPGRTIQIANIIGTLDDMPNLGTVVFVKDGEEYRLEAVDEGDGQLFLVFADRTSGHETYGAGRFLYAEPAVDGKTVVDFNKAYNPPCVFTPYATCPLAPPENRLDLRITAGEMKYAKAAH